MKKVVLSAAVLVLLAVTSCSSEKDCRCTAIEQEGIEFDDQTEYAFTTEEDNCTKGFIEFAIGEFDIPDDEIPSESFVRQIWDCNEE